MTGSQEEEHSLIAEQLSHTLDLIRGEISSIKDQQCHLGELNDLRLKNLESQAVDFEKRLRGLSESATQFKLLVSLAAGGGLLSMIELVRSLLRL